MPAWQEFVSVIEQYFIGNLPFSFLRHRLLKRTMFVQLPNDSTKLQKKLVLEYFGMEKAKQLLREHNTGAPILNDFEYVSSGNTTHHLYHLAKFGTESGLRIENINSIVEWGGGYGNMARLAKTINKDMTYIIIDIPIFSYIQFVYLNSTLGRNAVVLCEQEAGVEKGKVNIVPLHIPHLLALVSQISGSDVFLSTWALSESNLKTQELIRNLNYFEARNLLIAYQKEDELFPFARNVEHISDSYSVEFQSETEYLKDNYYLFCKKIRDDC
ncbi:hypothetical protein LJC19_02105 [Oxalobacter sp. OttesenSCG-928-P03]|nr:hypothetical protein [Oxalobacter sp. OttesenSCG-928-P03]